MKNLLNILKYFPYIFRRRFKEKYIIIESDDWGLQQSIDEGGIEYLKRKYGITIRIGDSIFLIIIPKHSIFSE